MEDDFTGAYYWTHRDEDALTYDAVPAIDLSIADSPVCAPFHLTPIPTMRTHGRGYILLEDRSHPPTYVKHVHEDTVRIMRARFLARIHYYRLYIDCLPLTYYERDKVLHDYFGGALYQLPRPLLVQSRSAWRQYLADVLSRPVPPPDMLEGRLIESMRYLD